MCKEVKCSCAYNVKLLCACSFRARVHGHVSTVFWVGSLSGAFVLATVRILHRFSERSRPYRDQPEQNRCSGEICPHTELFPWCKWSLGVGFWEWSECLMCSHKSLSGTWMVWETLLSKDQGIICFQWLKSKNIRLTSCGAKSPELGI